MSAVISIIVGSASDLGVASKAADLLKEFGVQFEIGIASAHRTPEDVVRYASGAADRGILTIIAMAGLSAALPGVIAAHTALPVIGVPIASGPLSGFDALTAIAQMPPGVPVACMSIDGARNAALMALRIAAIRDESLCRKLREWTNMSADSVRQSREKIVESEGMKRIPDHAFKGEIKQF